jgi:hypothetical protein
MCAFLASRGLSPPAPPSPQKYRDNDPRQAQGHEQGVKLHEPILHGSNHVADEARYLADQVHDAVDDVLIDDAQHMGQRVERRQDEDVVQLVDIEAVARQLVGDRGPPSQSRRGVGGAAVHRVGEQHAADREG